LSTLDEDKILVLISLMAVMGKSVFKAQFKSEKNFS